MAFKAGLELAPGAECGGQTSVGCEQIQSHLVSYGSPMLVSCWFPGQVQGLRSSLQSSQLSGITLFVRASFPLPFPHRPCFCRWSHQGKQLRWSQWNGLLPKVHQVPSLLSFKRMLKTVVFREVFNDILV